MFLQLLQPNRCLIMPIEIKEMHIKINVDSAQSGSKGGGSGSSNESVIQECLDQVAKMVNDKNER